MDTVTDILLVFLGLGVGAGATYIYTRMQFKQLLEHINNENALANSERTAEQENIAELQAKLSSAEEEAARLRQEWQEEKKKREIAEDNSQRAEVATRELEAANRKIEVTSRELETANRKIEAINREVEAVNQRMEAASRELEAANQRMEASNREIEAERQQRETAGREVEVAMAKTIEAKDRAMGKLMEEIAMLKGRVAELEQTLEEHKNTLDDGLVFVQGNHYLPGSVIRSLTRKKEGK